MSAPVKENNDFRFEMAYSVYHLPGLGYVAVQRADYDEDVLLWTSSIAWPTEDQAQKHADEL